MIQLSVTLPPLSSASPVAGLLLLAAVGLARLGTLAVIAGLICIGVGWWKNTHGQDD